MQIPKRNIAQKTAHILGLYGMYLKLYFRTMVEYRGDTWIAIIAGLIAQMSGLVFITAIFNNIPNLSGWNFYELLFIFSLAVTGRALGMTFLNAPFGINGYIKYGGLDMALVRPVGPLFQIIGQRQDINGLGSALTGLGIMIYAASHLDIAWNVGTVLYTFVALISNVLILYAVLMIIVVSAFWTLEIRSLIYPVSWMVEFTRYPIEIFHPLLRTLLTYIVPFALGSFYPAAFIMRPDDYTWAVWAVPATAAILTWISYQLWCFGLKRYSSATG